ncbi:MAG TPA: GntR family transcriptional regulator [Nevskiaceae bacterium]|nr:GntR family transcriptional regulator [Nevskiaceae bacterium]
MFTLVHDDLRERILSGELAPGDRLVESRLSTQLAVSRIPIREALHALASEGLITIEPRKGASVTVLSHDTALFMVEVRAALERLNARLAAEHHADEIVAKLQSILEKAEVAADRGDVDTCSGLNRAFHTTLAAAAGNPVLLDMMNSLRDRTAPVFASSSAARIKESWREHEQILRAVIAGNVELAGLLAEQHVHSVAASYSGFQKSGA